MQARDKSVQQISFGEFALDLRTGELRTNGRKVYLQEQSLQILIALLRCPGDLITRDELVKRLWPSDTYVDFEHSLNKAVNRLRRALGDSAERPLYIETVPRRGYRWIATVNGSSVDRGNITSQSGGGSSGNLYSRPREHETTVSSGPGPVLAQPISGTPRKRRSAVRVTVAAFGLLILLSAAGAFWLRWPSKPPKILKYTRLTTDGKSKDALRTDGVRLYFQLGVPVGFALVQVSTTGGEPAPIASFENVALLDVSPSGAELLLQQVRDGLPNKLVYVQQLPAGVPRRLGAIVANAVAYSPDGEQIAYTFDSNLYLAKRDGSDPRKLATVAGFAAEPRWSPDGKRLRFTLNSLTSADSAIWEINADGSHLGPLLPGWKTPPDECCGQWTPDGRYFLFLSMRDHLQNLWAIREGYSYSGKTGRSPVQLTLGSMEIRSYIPSKDGKRLFVVAGNDRGELVRFDAGDKQFHTYLAGMNAAGLGFSKDGKWVAYTDRANGALWRSKVDGSERVQLTRPNLYALKPRWSPDGGQIAFAGYAGHEPGQVFLVSAGGGVPQQLTNGSRGVGFVSWSPDGKSLLVGEWNGDGQEADYHKIHCYFLELQTRKHTALPASAGLYGPAWSPNGRYVAAKSQVEDLLLFDMTSQKWVELAKGPAQWATWSRDSRYLYFASVLKGDPAMIRVRASDKKLELVTSLAELNRQNFGSSPSWLGLAPNDALLALRDVSGYDIYSLDWQLP
jgi:Tol biopolymer transport system component/DNA-binding winged helix-turn-helix (wHTH) protein